MLDIKELIGRTVPNKTVLFLGSGAAITSGGPTGSGLARDLVAALAPGEKISDDLIEVASILENRVGRQRLVEEVRSRLKPLKPAGGMLSLPDFPWRGIYTTNFDCLIESAYRARSCQSVVVRSNFEYCKVDAGAGVPLFKIHGCITQDIVDGHRGRMTLTERDYEEYQSFREVLFRQLALDLVTRDMIIIGHSLKDPHVKRDVLEATKLQKEKGVSGRICVLVYERDSDRTALLEQKGVQVCVGSLDDFLHGLGACVTAVAAVRSDIAVDDFLETAQRVATTSVDQARSMPVDVTALFHGSPASFADIDKGLTFGRTCEDQAIDKLKGPDVRFLIITGVGGVGKTTLARRIVSRLCAQGFRGWEHRAEFPFRAVDWLEVEKKLRSAKETGVLLVDECLDTLRQVNTLADGLSRQDGCALRLVLTANHAQWLPRIKSPEIFRRGSPLQLSELDQRELEALVNLCDNQAGIAKLVDQQFLTLGRRDKLRHLRNRCGADMFVCLKNIFAFESLDTILLKEYAQLDPPLQDIYRHVAAIEASGAMVHRQLMLRLLNVSPSSLAEHLRRLQGLVDEYDIKPEEGIYGWRTRHEVIGQILTRYKFSDEAEVYDLFRRMIEHLNPTLWIERKLVRDLCSREFGIGRLSDQLRQCELYRALIDLVPLERIPRHRLVHTLIRMGSLDLAEDAIVEAERDVKLDPPLHRYRVQIKMRRATDTPGLAKEDRAAMLRVAESSAANGVERYPGDKLAYAVYADVGVAIAELTRDVSTLDAAIATMRLASDRILDPHFDDMMRRYERQADSLRPR